MTKISKTILISVILATVILTVLLTSFFIPAPKDPVAIQDDGIYFFMGKGELFRKKGEPYDKHENDLVTPQKDYYYHESIYGYDADVSYTFVRNDLISVSVGFGDISQEDAKDLSEKIIAAQKEKYESKSTYYDNGYTETEYGFEYEHGTNTGAGGISYIFLYQNNSLVITADKME